MFDGGVARRSRLIWRGRTAFRLSFFSQFIRSVLLSAAVTLKHLNMSLKRQKVETMNSKLASILLMTCLFVSATPANAQREPGQQKFDYLYGTRSFSANAAGNHISNARQYTQQLYDFTQCAPPQQVIPLVTKVESEHIGQTIHTAKQNLSVVKKDLDRPADPAVVKKVETIEKYLEAALKHHKMMDMECCKEKVDGSAVAGCCDEVLTNLDKALAEQASLMRLLGISPKPSTTSK